MTNYIKIILIILMVLILLIIIVIDIGNNFQNYIKSILVRIDHPASDYMRCICMCTISQIRYYSTISFFLLFLKDQINIYFCTASIHTLFCVCIGCLDKSFQVNFSKQHCCSLHSVFTNK